MDPESSVMNVELKLPEDEDAYIIKNLCLISAAIVVAAATRVRDLDLPEEEPAKLRRTDTRTFSAASTASTAPTRVIPATRRLPVVLR